LAKSAKLWPIFSQLANRAGRERMMSHCLIWLTMRHLPRREEADMSLGLAFWVLMLIWLVFGLVSHFYTVGPYGTVVSTLLLFVLFLLLGWQVFGAPLHK
jgi:hypothetical protein